MGTLEGKAVVVTFLDAQCTDACPVVAGELARAASPEFGEKMPPRVRDGLAGFKKILKGLLREDLKSHPDILIEEILDKANTPLGKDAKLRDTLSVLGLDPADLAAEKGPVWDSGVRLDHSVRTPSEARRLAADDLKVHETLHAAGIKPLIPNRTCWPKDGEQEKTSGGRLPPVVALWRIDGGGYSAVER